MDCVKQTYRGHGFLGFYRGLSVLLFVLIPIINKKIFFFFRYGSIPKSSFRFGTFEFLKSHAIDEKGNLSPFMRLACGLGAGLSEAIFAVTPMETVKVKFIHDQTLEKPRFRGFLHGLGVIVKSEGVGVNFKKTTNLILQCIIFHLRAFIRV